MLFYCPLELYKERYTMQWSAPKTGWLERNWIKEGVQYKRIDSDFGPLPKEDIKIGRVLDTNRRTKHCFSQITQIIELLEKKEITEKDCIFFDDFWHPGIEMLPYTFQQLKVWPKLYAFCHAQSVDEFDFTYPMRWWMRHFEKGIGKILSGIFVNSTILKNLLSDSYIASPEKIKVIGHIFNEEEVRERMPSTPIEREDKVVFSSRWDNEKNPEFFLAVAENVIRTNNNVKFVVCTSSSEIKSNHPKNISKLKQACQAYPNNIILKEGLSKEEYYKELCSSKIQFNCANQDFISIALLEASVAGCYPVYPYFRSFPEAFRGNLNFMYNHLNVWNAVEKIKRILSKDLWTEKAIEERNWIHKRHNDSWKRMLNAMLISNIKVSEYV